MKKSTYLLAPAMAFMLFAASCDKVETEPSTPTPDPKPSGTVTPPSPIPTGSDLSGALISINMVYSSQPAGSPFPVELNTEIGTAIFYNAPGGTSYVDAGAVSVNSIALEKQSNNVYSKVASIGMTPSDLKFDGGSNWNVAGSGSVAAFTYNHSTSFPKFSGDVPTSVTKSSGVTLTLTSSTVKNADSVYVLIASGDKSFLKAYVATSGTVTISAADLSSLPAATNNTGIFEVCPFKYNIASVGGKKYVFIKEQAVVKNININ